MKIVLIGASGTVGSAIVQELGQRHDIIAVGRNSGQHQVDITRSDSIRALFERIGKVDAIVSAAGGLHFGPLSEMTAEQFKIGLHDKLLGQVDLALIGQHYLNEGGSITLTSGIVSAEPIRYGANASAVNSAIDGFARRGGGTARPPHQRRQPQRAASPGAATARTSWASRRCLPSAWRWPTAAAWKARRPDAYSRSGKRRAGHNAAASGRQVAGVGVEDPSRTQPSDSYSDCAVALFRAVVRSMRLQPRAHASRPRARPGPRWRAAGATNRSYST